MTFLSGAWVFQSNLGTELTAPIMTHLVSLRLGVGDRSGGTHLIVTTLSSYLNHCKYSEQERDPGWKKSEGWGAGIRRRKRKTREVGRNHLGDFWVTYPASLSPRESPDVVLRAEHFLKPLRPLRVKEFSFPHARLVREVQMWPVVRFSCTNISCDLTTLFNVF